MNSCSAPYKVFVMEDVALNPESENLIQVGVKFCFNKDNLLFLPFSEKLLGKSVMSSTSICHAREGLIPIIMKNTSDIIVTLPKDLVLGIADPVDDLADNESHIRTIENYQRKEKDTKHIDDLLKRTFTEEGFSCIESDRINNLVLRFSHIFSKSKVDIGCCDKVKHEIITKPIAPVNLKSRRIPMALESKVDDIVNDWLEKGVIRPAVSPWNSPLVIVRKKNNDIRLCVDFRSLNAATLRPIFPIPDTKDILDHLQNSYYFSTIDLSSAFHQCTIEERDKQKTAFSTRHGQYEFNRMPFGLCGAPATFQRLMHEVLKADNWKKCLIYIDDIIIYAPTFSEHLSRLEAVFQRLSEAGIKLSPDKCNLFQTKIKFLGHEISSDGISADPEKLDLIRNWKKPDTKDEMRSFLGFCNYYRKFLAHYAELVIPLEAMLVANKEKKLFWKEENINSFASLKTELVSSNILAFPNNKDTFILDTDASFTAIGAVLSQKQGTEEKVIEFASKKMTKTQQRYCITRKEMLAVVTFVKQFHHYLLGKRFIIRTDHKALIFMLNWEKPNSTQYCKWIADLQYYDFAIEHRKGEKHSNADFMSRCEQCEMKHEHPLKRRISKNIAADEGRLNVISVKNVADKMSIIKKTHENLGHIGINKMKNILEETFNWPNLNKLLKEYTMNCPECLMKKTVRTKPIVMKHITAQHPFQTIAIDIAGELPQSKYGFRYILAIIDVFTRYPMLIPLRQTNSHEIFKQIFTRWISIFGYPQKIISDNAPNVHSEEIIHLCRKCGIEKDTSCPYYPQGNGIAERLIGTVKDRIFCTTLSKKCDWVDSIPFVEMGLRTSDNSTINTTPNKVVFGRIPRMTPNMNIFQTHVNKYKSNVSQIMKS